MPVTVTHAFGTTTIEKRPTRIATVGWGNHEVPLALGVVPVGMSKATWGDDDADGVLPWVEKRIEELAAECKVTRSVYVRALLAEALQSTPVLVAVKSRLRVPDDEVKL